MNFTTRPDWSLPTSTRHGEWQLAQREKVGAKVLLLAPYPDDIFSRTELEEVAAKFWHSWGEIYIKGEAVEYYPNQFWERWFYDYTDEVCGKIDYIIKKGRQKKVV